MAPWAVEADEDGEVEGVGVSEGEAVSLMLEDELRLHVGEGVSGAEEVAVLLSV